MRVGQIRILAWAVALVITALLFLSSRARESQNADSATRRLTGNVCQSPPALLPNDDQIAVLPVPTAEPEMSPADISDPQLRTAHVIREPRDWANEPELSSKAYRSKVQVQPQKDLNHLPLDVLLKEPPRQGAAIEPRVSKDLSTVPDSAFSRPVPLPIMASENPAMQPVHAAARQHVIRGFSLGDKGAVYAARTEFIQALRTIAQAVDAQAGLTPQDPQSCSMALVRGLQALAEADDFAPGGSRLDGNLDLGAMINAHRTPACKQHQPASQLAALQAYLDYARGELQRAAVASPIAAQALTGLGKSHTVATEKNQGRLALAKAMVFHQAAVATDARNHLSGNELGVLLAKHGQWEPAKQAFLQSLRVQPDLATWQNLAAVHRKLGERELADLAEQECEIIRGSSSSGEPLTIDGKPRVQWVDPKTFAGPPEDGLPAPRPVQSNARSTARSSAPKSWLRLK